MRWTDTIIYATILSYFTSVGKFALNAGIRGKCVVLEKQAKAAIPVITVILAALNILAFAVTEYYGSSLDSSHMIHMGAMYEPFLLEDHEYYRLVSCMFLHFGMEHLMNNMISLLVLGYSLEHAIGKVWFGFIYLGAGFISSIVSFLYNMQTGQEVVSCGASGAIFGLMGALLVLLVVYRRRNLRGEIPRFVLYLALSLYTGFQDPGIDGAAHAGGFISGMLICVIMCVIKRFYKDRKGQKTK